MLQVGRRMTEDGYILWQNTSYFTETPEQLTDSQPRTYTVVGIIERPAFEPYSAPGYTVITRLTDSFLADDDTVSLYLIMRHPHRIYDFLPQLAKRQRLFRQRGFL